MLELMGSEYVIEHVVAEHNRRAEERGYRIYVTDVIKAIAEATGAISVSERYADLIKRDAEEDNRTGDEIALSVIERLGLKWSEDESA